MTPIVRIILRYGFGALAAFGILTPEQAAFGETLAADPDVIAAVAVVGAVLVEAWYALAKYRGGAT